jgi:23S rRNA pseudouridine1911/1915/1917 synthase
VAKPVSILFEDNHLIVLSKAAGLLSQGEHRGDPNLVDWLRAHLGRPYVGLVHRLDRNTSGVMVVAKRTKSAQRLTEALKEGKICRLYLAWVEGTIREAQRWRHHLVKDEKTNVVRAVASSNPKAREALTRATPVDHGTWNGRPLTLLELELETGRSHQIRVQAAKTGHPLLGDRKYGGSDRPDFPRPALHSFRIEFPHPMSDEAMAFEDPLPPDMAGIERGVSGA